MGGNAGIIPARRLPRPTPCPGTLSLGCARAALQAQREQLLATVTDMASTGLRTLCLAYTDFPESDPSRPADFFSQPHEENLTMLCIVGIKASAGKRGRRRRRPTACLLLQHRT